jgi:tetratricopeptide (TPR) repeat protein
MQTTLSWSDTLQEKLTHAENSYQKALEAHTVAERQEALNDALSNYLDAYKEIPKETLAKGDVSYNMGNILYLLEEYPWAILYYLKALKNIPDNTYLEHNLALAREKLGIKVEKKNYTYWIEWPRYYPEQMFLKILFISSMAVLFFYGVKIWTKRSIWSYIAKFCLLGVLVGAYGLLYLRYIAPIEAVAMHPILLHRAPGERTPLVTSIPILAGSVLNVVEISRDEEWVKVSNQDGTVGYVPSDGLRFVVLLE